MDDAAKLKQLEEDLGVQLRTVAQLRRQVEELTDLLEHIDVGLHRVGRDGTILWANSAELALMGYGRDEYVGRNIADFHVERGAAAEILRRLAAGEVLRDHPAELITRSGAVRKALISSSAWLRDGEFVHTRCHTRLLPAAGTPVGPTTGSLVVLYRGEQFPVTLTPFTIGRGKSCELRILDANVSRIHCTIRLTPEGYLLADTGSTCGIEMNGQRVVQRILRDGDVVQVCDHSLAFQLR